MLSYKEMLHCREYWEELADNVMYRHRKGIISKKQAVQEIADKVMQLVKHFDDKNIQQKAGG